MTRTSEGRSADVTPPGLLNDTELQARHLELAVRRERSLSGEAASSGAWQEPDDRRLETVEAEVNRRYRNATKLWRRIVWPHRASRWISHLEDVDREAGMRAAYRHGKAMPDHEEAGGK